MDNPFKRPYNRKPARWMIPVALVAVVALVLAAWFGMSREQVASIYDPTRPTQEIVYEGQTWEVKGAPVAFPEAQMTMVGQTREGFDVYANVEQGYERGGGGGEITPGTEPRAWGRIYLKTPEGRYQPLFLKQ